MKEELKKKFAIIGCKDDVDTQKLSADLEDTDKEQMILNKQRIHRGQGNHRGQGGSTP